MEKKKISLKVVLLLLKNQENTIFDFTSCISSCFRSIKKKLTLERLVWLYLYLFSSH